MGHVFADGCSGEIVSERTSDLGFENYGCEGEGALVAGIIYRKTGNITVPSCYAKRAYIYTVEHTGEERAGA